MPSAFLPFTQHLPGTTVAFDMLPIPGGRFAMGAAADDPDAQDWSGEKNIHPVQVSSFYLGKYPVTQAVFKAVMNGYNPSYFTGDDRPVEQVSWLEATVFCNQLNEIIDMEPCYFADKRFQRPFGKTSKGYELTDEGEVFIRRDAQGYRLPTEAEWEYAAKAGTPYRYAGSDKLKEVGWFNTNSHWETKPVGLKIPNAFGLYDMSGNVWEWCEDRWDEQYYAACGAQGTVTDPPGPDSGSYRVLRGGSWGNYPQGCRAANRGSDTPGHCYGSVGFRLSRTL